MTVGNAVGAAVLWYLVALGFMMMPPLLGIPWILLLAGSFYWLFVRHGAWPALNARLRLDGVRGGMSWVVLSSVAFVLFDVTFLLLLARFVPHASSSSPAFEAYQALPLGRLAFGVLIVVLAPLIEEFLFRGALLGSLEPRLGPALAILISAALFAIVHVRLWALPDFFLFGLAAGWLVYRTGSLWAGITLHAAANLSLTLIGALDAWGIAWVKMRDNPTPSWVLFLLLAAASVAFVTTVLRIPQSAAVPVDIVPANVDAPAASVSSVSP